MGADNTDEKINHVSEVDSVTTNTRSQENSQVSNSSGSSHGSHGSSTSHSSHSSSGRHRSSHSKSSSKTASLSTKYEKQKKAKIWFRSIFVAMIAACIIWLIVMIFTSGGPKAENWNTKFSNAETKNNQAMSAEIDQLKTENMKLKYELDKYKDQYGELGADEEAQDTESTSTKTSGNTTKNTKSSGTVSKKTNQ